MISIQDFRNMELVIARIKEVTVHPQADRLYVLKVETGKEEKQLVAGIRQFYQPEQLVGRQILLVNNLEPAEIRGVKSEGMLLATHDEKGIAILQPDREVVLGSPVK